MIGMHAGSRLNRRIPAGACRSAARSQSAMEYLMTYGWAILIIAVVLGALYSLGVFNAVNFAPKVPGGGCHVFRPNGPGTSWNVNLVGSCNNALPQYVAQFNGQSSLVSVGSPSILLGLTRFTVSAWVRYVGPISGVTPDLINLAGSNQPFISIDFYGPNTAVLFLGASNYKTFLRTPVDYLNAEWHNVVFVITGYGQSDIQNAQMYVDANLESTAGFVDSGPPNPISGPVLIGKNANSLITNLQIYNTSLTANQVAYLYNEGIGGVPISPQYLVGWWPLNGDTTDYSGNNNNGAATAITFNGTWTGSYNIP